MDAIKTCSTFCDLKNAVCFQGQCVCHQFFEGGNCTERWSGNQDWKGMFDAYTIYTAIFFIGISIFAIVLIFISCISSPKKWNLPLITTIGCLIGTSIRAIDFIMDPHNYYNRVSPALDGILFSIPFLIWLNCAFMACAYWIELIIVTDVKEFVFVRKLRPFVIVFAITTAVSILPLAIWNAVAHTWLTDLIFNCSITLSALVLILCMLIGGFKFLRLLNYVWKLTKRQSFYFALKQITYSMIASVVILITIIITLAIYPFVFHNKWAFISLQSILRTQEGAAVVSLLVAVMKPRKRTEEAERLLG